MMWAAVRSDLSEFVSSVAEETDQVTKAVISDDGEVLSTHFEDTGAIQSAEDEVIRLMNNEETFSTPLSEGDEDVQKFLDAFDIESKTDEIAKILQANPITVKLHFEALVPTQISYELFWQRYFYRCDADRIADYWKAREEAQRRARSEAIQGGIKSVTSMFGGALNAVSQSLEKADQSKKFKGVSEQALSGGGIRMFGNEGRPPFVMNTVVDEDGEEEELGWDDDDSDGDEDDAEVGNEENHLNVSDEENAVTEDFNEQLETVINERDSLQETVELQRKEITKLRDTTLNIGYSKEIEQLRITLCEKDSELVSLRASLEGNAEGSIEQIKKDDTIIAALNRDMEKLKSEVSAKDTELNLAQKQIGGLEVELVKTKEEAKTKIESLTQALASSKGSGAEELSVAKEEACAAQSMVEILKLEVTGLKKELLDTKTQNQEMENQSLELVAAKEKIKELNLEVENLESERKRVSSLQQELEQLQEQMQHTPSHRSSPSSESTGVKVDGNTSMPTESADDGWGDDW